MTEIKNVIITILNERTSKVTYIISNLIKMNYRKFIWKTTRMEINKNTMQKNIQGRVLR